MHLHLCNKIRACALPRLSYRDELWHLKHDAGERAFHPVRRTLQIETNGRQYAPCHGIPVYSYSTEMHREILRNPADLKP